MSYLKIGDSWPKKQADVERRKKYARNQMLFRGDHADIFMRVQEQLEQQKEIIMNNLELPRSTDISAVTYIITNFCGLISKLAADMLFGEHPTFKSESNQEDIDNLIVQNDFYTTLYESALGNSYRGDACLKVRYADIPYSEEKKVLIESQNPYYFTVESDPENIQRTLKQIAAWKVHPDETRPEDEYLRMEVHIPGMTYNYLYKLKGGFVDSEIDIKDFYPDLEEEQETNIPEFPIIHIPNWRTDDMFWGYSDYLDILTLQDELNNRYSQISKILDKHVDPNMKGPAMSKRNPTSGKKEVRVSGGNYFPYEKGGPEPEYLTWEAKLESAFTHIDNILKSMFMVTETSPAAFGLEKDGSSESGRALKFRLLRTVAKVNRKKRYYDNAARKTLYIAQMVENEYSNKNYTPEIPTTEWRDGLPDDPVEIAQEIESLDRGTAISIEQKVKKAHPDWNQEQRDQEVSRIKAEMKEERNSSRITL